MSLLIQLRIASVEDIPWINQKYDEVQFQHSHLPGERIVIASSNKEPVGLGRLFSVGENVYELGGIYVFPQYQGHGVAKHIVSFLLEQATLSSTIFCIPFRHLATFYERFGFTKVICDEKLPSRLVEKYAWCAQTYDQEVELLIQIKE